MVALAAKRIAVPVVASSPYLFGVRAACDSQAMMRIAGLFAQRDIIPEQISCRKSGECLLIDIEVVLDDVGLAQLLLEKIRALVLVERASLVEGRA